MSRVERLHEELTVLITTGVLRQRTADTHALVESTLDLLAPTLTMDRLGVVVARLHGYFAIVEPAMDAWARREPDLATALDWPRRRRSSRMAEDLQQLGIAGGPAPAPPFDHVDTAQALGWLYVAEGSTLGGAIIARRTASLTDALPTPLQTFSPYAEGPGPMWRSYGAVLDDWVGEDELRLRDVGDAAVAVFAGLETWVAPLRSEDAA